MILVNIASEKYNNSSQLKIIMCYVSFKYMTLFNLSQMLFCHLIFSLIDKKITSSFFISKNSQEYPTTPWLRCISVVGNNVPTKWLTIETIIENIRAIWVLFSNSVPIKIMA